MPSATRRAVARCLAVPVSLFILDGANATLGIEAAEHLAAPPLRASGFPPPPPVQDASAIEAVLRLDRPTRRLIQHGLRNEGFDPGIPDGLFGPRTRAAIEDWQQSRGAPPTGYLNRAEADLLRTAAVPPPAATGAFPARRAVPVVDASVLSTAMPPAPTGPEPDSYLAPATTIPADVDLLNAIATNAEQESRVATASGSAQLPPDIMADRLLVRVDRLLAADQPGAALQRMNDILVLQEEHDLELPKDFPYRHAQVAFATGRTDAAIASLNEYLVATGRAGEFYREALDLLDSAEVRLQREQVEQRWADVERRRAARWPPGHVFRDCQACPEMVVLPGSLLALGRYEVTVGEYGASASANRDSAGRSCVTLNDGDYSWRNPSFPQTDRHPVTCMSWEDAQAYVSGLSRGLLNFAGD